MCAGFERGAFEFFMALKFNNNREFFYANHTWYKECVRDPLKELCMDLAPHMLRLDSELEVRPARVISHINRDLRYSRDKSPYRDYMWLGFHRGGVPKRDCFHMYFDIGADGGHMGAGLYGDDRAWTDALRGFIARSPDKALAVLESDDVHAFQLGGGEYRRIKPPEGLPEPLERWYARKNVYLEHTYSPDELMSPGLVDDMAARFEALRPVYELMYSLRPERED